jgi:rod shape-determining protein MreD
MNWVHPIALVLTTVLLVFLQGWFSGFRGVLVAQPDFVPGLVVYSALSASLPTTAVTALLGGLCLDSFSAGPFGLSAVPLMGLGLFLHLRRDLLLKDSTWAQAALGGAAAAAVMLASLLLLFVLWPLLWDKSMSADFFPESRPGLVSLPEMGPGLIWQVTVVALGGAVGTPILFRWFGWILAACQYPMVPQPTIRQDREIKRGRS